MCILFINLQVTTVISCIKEQASIQNPATHLPVLHGDYFFVTFRSAILEHMLACSEHSVGCLMKDISAKNVQWVISIVTEVLQYYAKITKSKHQDRWVSCSTKFTLDTSTWIPLFKVPLAYDCVLILNGGKCKKILNWNHERFVWTKA
jgi:hypothetical protein